VAGTEQPGDSKQRGDDEERQERPAHPIHRVRPGRYLPVREGGAGGS
jgi:hypothetical protein